MVCCGQHNFSLDFSFSAHTVSIYYLLGIEIGHAGRHQDCHGELMDWQIQMQLCVE
jgi:hypothetical protein